MELDTTTVDPEIWRGICQGVGTVLAAVIVTVGGHWIAGKYQREKDKQEKDTQWRTHAIELTKLDMERKLKKFEKDPTIELRPSILDFLANYRDLTGLDINAKNAKGVYKEVLENRTQPIGKAEGKAIDTGGGKAVGTGDTTYEDTGGEQT